MREIFDDPSIDQITAEDLQGEYPAVQYVPPDGAFHIDSPSHGIGRADGVTLAIAI